MPFTAAQFFDVFAAYNAAVWPAQIAAYLLAVGLLLAIARGGPFVARFVLAVLATAWLGMGVVYHFVYFAKINSLAPAFGVAFIVQSLLLAASAATRHPPTFAYRRDLQTIAAVCLILYSAAVYPWLGYRAGHGGMQGPMLGVAPCPTTIFTFAMLMLMRPTPWWLAVIPTTWAAVGTAAAIGFGVPEDFGLPAAAAVAWLIWLRRRRTFAPP